MTGGGAPQQVTDSRTSRQPLSADISRPTASLRAPERVEPAPVALGRSGAEIGSQRARLSSLEGELLTAPDRLGCLLVERRGDRRGAALLGDREHGELSSGVRDRDLEPVAGADPFAGLTRTPFTCTRPPSTASDAALRVLKSRAAQSHRSTRTSLTAT